MSTICNCEKCYDISWAGKRPVVSSNTVLDRLLKIISKKY